MPEALLYVSQITKRKLAENGSDDSAPIDDDLINLLETIETVKRERKENG